MAATVTTLAEAIRDVFEPRFVEATFRNNYLLPLFGQPQDSRGGTAFQWKINSSGNDSVETYSEGEGLPDAGNQSYQDLSVTYLFFRFMTQITGHARAAIRDEGAFFAALEEEMSLGMKDMIDLINTTLMGSTSGLEVSIDSTTTYAGQARGSATWFESQETAVSDVIAHTDIQDMLETISDNDVGGRTTRILVPWNQNTRIYNITGGPSTQMVSEGDKAPGWSQMSFGGIPIIPMPDMTDTIALFLDQSEGNFKLVQHVPFSVVDQGRSADSDLYMTKWAGHLICKNPKVQGKLTGLTS